METTALAVVEPQEAVSLLESPLSPAETAQLQSCELAIELAGKDRLEKALIIGEKLSTIYNNALFRGADGGCTWEQWLKERLPKLLPEAEGRSVAWGDGRRLLWEERNLLATTSPLGGMLPSGVQVADSLKALVPRRFSRGDGGGWNPAILDDPDAAKGIAKVWKLACQNAEANKRRNGPTAEDVRAAREELRPELEKRGWIRSAPASFQAATAARVDAARQRTIDVTPPTPAQQERFNDTLANIRDTKAERQAKVEVDHVRQQLEDAEAERRHVLEEQVRLYNSRLNAASKTIHDLLVHMETLSRVHGTQFLAEMRSIEVLGLITVKDDMQRLQKMGTDLMKVVRLAQSCDPPSGVNMQTIDL